ncbi:MAG: glycosyltransferase family 4 protein [Actinobacteria bacterium]|nr:glycosyltransferase family 4 protein [Actinomycetota bacterium]
MAKIVAFTEYYLPGFAGGGTIVSTSRIVETETEHYFRVITRNHDLGSRDAYLGLAPRTWHRVGRAEVAYLRPGLVDVAWLRSELAAWRPDAYYVNSLQSPDYSMLPYLLLRARALPPAPLMVAPRGECSEGAQGHKAAKKKLARPTLRWLLGKRVTWHASSLAEESDIRGWYGRPLPSGGRVVVQSDPPPPPALAHSPGSQSEDPNLVFASRIDQMKGLDTALEMLTAIESPCTFTVFGSVSDEAYWARCRALAEKLPSNISFSYAGPYRPEEAAEIFSKADALVLPTRGENFGHAIAEALSVGCPVVISQNTIWTDMANSGSGVAGEPAACTAFLAELAALSGDQRAEGRRRAHASYAAWYSGHAQEASLFDLVLGD